MSIPKSPIKPLADKVVIAPDVPDFKTPGGIIIPDQAKEVPITGVVLAVGKGTEEHPVTVKRGDKVRYAPNAGNMIVIDDTPYLVMREETIYAILD